jgi:RecA-family ATPase
MLPYKKAAELSEVSMERSWLVEELWGEGAVGILGGEPKSCKSFLALDLAVSVASGTPCLGRFAVRHGGPVLLYAAEDSPSIVKRRLFGIAAARGVELTSCDIEVITAEKIRLDEASDVQSLEETIAHLRPRFLILDPFVRLHRIDENSSSEVAMVLEKLRFMQRRHNLGIMVVHHAKKGGGGIRGGQALRGSSEFHAWGDSNLYMRRRPGDQLVLTAEHRAAPGIDSIPLALHQNGDTLSLQLTTTNTHSDHPSEKPTHIERIESALSAGPMSLAKLRGACGIRTATLCTTLKNLTETGTIIKTGTGYALAIGQ